LTVVFGLWVESCGLSVVVDEKKFGLLESSVFEMPKKLAHQEMCPKMLKKKSAHWGMCPPELLKKSAS
jgi:hypothetical protein